MRNMRSFVVSILHLIGGRFTNTVVTDFVIESVMVFLRVVLWSPILGIKGKKKNYIYIVLSESAKTKEFQN